jgi:hypothetical protein
MTNITRPKADTVSTKSSSLILGNRAVAGSNLLSRGSERKDVALEEREKAERKLGSLERFILEAAGIARKIIYDCFLAHDLQAP